MPNSACASHLVSETSPIAPATHHVEAATAHAEATAVPAAG